MSLFRVLRRVVATLIVTVAVVPVLAPTVHAAPDTVGAVTITVVTPDPTNLRLVCTSSFTMQSSVGMAGSSVYEAGSLEVSSSSCGPGVSWTPTVTVIDESPGRATRATSHTGIPGNPAFAADSQTVAYGLGVREVGIVTIQFEGTSRLGTYCFADKWRIDYVTRVSTFMWSQPCVA